MSRDWNNIHILYYIIYYSTSAARSFFIFHKLVLLVTITLLSLLPFFLCRQAGGSVVSRTQDTMVRTKFNIKPFPIRQSSLKLCYIDVLLATSPQLYLASISIPPSPALHALSLFSIYPSMYLHLFIISFISATLCS